jgi:hypothetical protein
MFLCLFPFSKFNHSSPPVMSLLAWIGVTLLAGLGLFVAEVATIIAKSEHRPSVYLTLLGRRLYDLFWGLATLMGIFADVFGFVRRFILWLRDTFFRFIPREAILQALADLRAAFREITRSPLGFFSGLYASILDAALPWLSVTLLLTSFVVAPVVLEVLLYVADVQTRPSTIMAATALLAYNGFWRVGNIPNHFRNLKALVMAIVEPLFALLFGWVPKEAIQVSTQSVLKEAGELAFAPKGLYDGFKAAVGMDVGDLWKIHGEPLTAILLVAVGLAVMVFCLKKYPPQPIVAVALDDRSEDDDDEDGDDDVNEAAVVRPLETFPMKRRRANHD